MTRKARRETALIYADSFMRFGPDEMAWYFLLWGEWEGIVDGQR